MKKMWELLKSDKEIQQFRQEWQEKFKEALPPWNYDCFGDIDDYKQRIKTALEAGNPKTYAKLVSGKHVRCLQVLSKKFGQLNKEV